MGAVTVYCALCKKYCVQPYDEYDYDSRQERKMVKVASKYNWLVKWFIIMEDGSVDKNCKCYVN